MPQPQKPSHHKKQHQTKNQPARKYHALKLTAQHKNSPQKLLHLQYSVPNIYVIKKLYTIYYQTTSKRLQVNYYKTTSYIAYFRIFSAIFSDKKQGKQKPKAKAPQPVYKIFDV